MALYTIGDLHLSFATEKPMDIFKGWENYQEKIEHNWRSKITAEDTVVVAGDVSWAQSMEEGLLDFQFLQSLPGEKILLKGNHDYWWTTVKKMEDFLFAHGLDTIKILHNSCIVTQNVAVCGSRGWLFEKGEAHDQKILAREAGRLELSIQAAGNTDKEKIVFLHYPPVFGEAQSPEILDVLLKHEIKRCYYGHIHGAGMQFALNGIYMGIDFRLISADFIGFDPIKVDKM